VRSPIGDTHNDLRFAVSQLFGSLNSMSVAMLLRNYLLHPSAGRQAFPKIQQLDREILTSITLREEVQELLIERRVARWMQRQLQARAAILDVAEDLRRWVPHGISIPDDQPFDLAESVLADGVDETSAGA
jgi:hypothetical protein